ncbi:MAG TPA: helical backbone metal receptor [Burkholderiaceae bacterium]|nr:helical backbone metal receptor [Burkholderiaceae bacterium]HNB47627.1 helical backbone metal receptor [Burkholderiaceae bacterium]HNG82300.1 helical backbone metal receptor [Burkholderiaceae bacterium]
MSLRIFRILRILQAVVGLLALAVAPLAAAAGLEISDDRGVTQRFAAPPQRIVSMLPSLTESLCALGACNRLVGVDRYSNWPASVEKLPRLGGLDDALIEAIAALRPEVVLASTSARSLDRLDALGIRVLRLRSETHADVRRTLGLLAELIGQPGQAASVWAAIERDLAAAAARVPAGLRGARVYFEIDGGPYAAGARSFIGETIGRLGLANIVPAELGPFPKLNPEFVLRARPEVVMGVQRQAAAMAQRPGWAQLPAIRQGRRCDLPTPQYEMMIRPGPRLGEAAGILADCLQRLPALGATP